MIKIAPSILASNFARLADEIKQVEAAGADLIHIDVMDGHFVPNITVGAQTVTAVAKETKLPLDVHLMITDPERSVNDFIAAGASLVTVHPEACLHIYRTVDMIKKSGVQAGVALNPGTPLSEIEFVLPYVDLVLIMTVEPGFGGQDFIDGMLPKITALRKMCDHRKIPLEIQVDGGIKVGTARKAAEAGATILVAGTAVFEGDTVKESIAALRSDCEGI